jgi:aminoglycoside phosphotransferase (APT) family kinase protein
MGPDRIGAPYAGPVLRGAPPAEVTVDAALVRRLLRAQHPDLAGLPLRRIGAGWDNVVLRLGPELCVRVPRRARAAPLIATELAWLPGLASQLPLPVPEPVRAGGPADDYPWPWLICRYVPGQPLAGRMLGGARGLRGAEDLAALLVALHVAAPRDAPRNAYRGVPLSVRAPSVELALPAAPARSRARVQQAWVRALSAPEHHGPPRWLHGDLHGLNILAARGRISGVIDFGDLCAGDPATDLAVAWLVLDGPARRRLRQLVAPDDAIWERARGWAVLLGLMFALHARDDQRHAEIGRRTLDAVVADD